MKYHALKPISQGLNSANCFGLLIKSGFLIEDRADRGLFAKTIAQPSAMNFPKFGIRTQLLASQILGQLAPVAATPLLTRLISPQEMGRYQIALSITLVAIPFAVYQTDVLIPLACDKKEIRSLQLKASLSTLAVGSIGMFAASALDGFHGLGAPITTFLLITAMSLIAVTNASLIRKGDMAKLVQRNLLGGVLVAAIQTACSAAYPTAISLGIGMLLGRSLCQAALASSKNYQPQVAGSGEQGSFWRVMSGAGANALGSFASQMPILVIAPAYGAAVAGHLGLGQRVVGAPTGLIGQGVNQIIVSEASAIIRGGEPKLWSGLRRPIFALTSLSLLTAAAIGFVISPATTWLFGDAWAAAGQFMQILAVPMSLQLVAVPMITLMSMLGMQPTMLALQIGRILGIFACVFCGSLFSLGILKTIALISVLWTAVYVGAILLTVAAIRKHDSRKSIPASGEIESS